MEADDHWTPDDALVATIRTRSLPISSLSGPDRSWVVAALTVKGWTVKEIAERLQCSLRLIQMIKTEPMTRVAVYALGVSSRYLEAESLHQLENIIAAQRIGELEARVDLLRNQRDALVASIQRGGTHDPRTR